MFIAIYYVNLFRSPNITLVGNGFFTAVLVSMLLVHTAASTPLFPRELPIALPPFSLPHIFCREKV